MKLLTFSKLWKNIVKTFICMCCEKRITTITVAVACAEHQRYTESILSISVTSHSTFEGNQNVWLALSIFFLLVTTSTFHRCTLRHSKELINIQNLCFIVGCNSGTFRKLLDKHTVFPSA